MTAVRKTVIMFFAVGLLAAGAARAEVVQRGNLRVAVSGALTPTRLPRTGTAPIAVTVGGKITTTDGSLPPQLHRLQIELNRHGRLETTGLPECMISRIQPASTARALGACRPALVGRGTFTVDAVLGGGEPYPTAGTLLVFNGSYKGRPALLAQIYAAHPFATSFVIPFVIHHLPHGLYGTSLTATVPPALAGWGHVTGLQMRLHRKYSYRGKRHSLISAGCPAPEGVGAAVFTLARTAFSFAGGVELNSSLERNCQAA
jgi:hypothetical protein